MNKQTTLSQIIASTLSIESETLARIAASPPTGLVQLVDVINSSSGRLIVTGVGKSGLAAQKLSATFNSTGTPSVYMHGGDAVHGDLGMVQPGDVVIVISKSGTNEEVTRLIEPLKSRKAMLVAWTSNKDSLLAMSSDIVIHIPVLREADPHGLAPTASTVAHIAVGDALAMALQYANGWSEQSFAELHPGGTLGRRLHMQISELVKDRSAPQVGPSASIREVILSITSGRLGATAVVVQRQLVGIITDGDLRRMLQSHDDIEGLAAEDIMTTSPKSVVASELAYDVLQLLESHSINQVIVQSDGDYIGMVHLHELVSLGF